MEENISLDVFRQKVKENEILWGFLSSDIKKTIELGVESISEEQLLKVSSQLSPRVFEETTTVNKLESVASAAHAAAILIEKTIQAPTIANDTSTVKGNMQEELLDLFKDLTVPTEIK